MKLFHLFAFAFQLGVLNASTTSSEESVLTRAEALLAKNRSIEEFFAFMDLLGLRKYTPLIPDSRWNLLFEAVHQDNLEAVKVLVETFRFDVNITDPIIGSPISHVKSREMTQYLLKQQAASKPFDGKKPDLFEAVQAGMSHRAPFLAYKIIPFEQRIAQFDRHMYDLRVQSYPIQLISHRERVVDEFIRFYSHISASGDPLSLSSNIKVNFTGDSFDKDSVKEWISLLVEHYFHERSIFVHNYFRDWSEPSATVDLFEFEQAGYLAALGLHHNIPLQIKFTPIFYQVICGFVPESNVNFVEMLRTANPVLLGNFEQHQEQANREELVRSQCRLELFVKFAPQLQSFMIGFDKLANDLSNKKPIMIYLSPEELSQVIFGESAIDVAAWKSSSMGSETVQLQWFWEAVNTMTQPQLLKLVSFITGLPRVPFSWYSRLKSTEIITLPEEVDSDLMLPVTGMPDTNQLQLPSYSSADVLKQQLLDVLSS